MGEVYHGFDRGRWYMGKPKAQPDNMVRLHVVGRLELEDSRFDKLLEGKKTVTVRLGLRKILLGTLNIKASNSDRDVIVNVTKIRACRLDEVDIREIWNSGYQNQNDFFTGMKNIYPDITEDSIVTVVEFEYE